MSNEEDGSMTASPAPAGADRLSVLGQLKTRREQVLKDATLSLPVPRWTEPEIVVTYQPVDHAIIRKAINLSENKQVKESRRSEAEMNANCDILIAGCISVVGRLDGNADQEYSLRPGDPTGEPTTFDEDLANALGCTANARAIVRDLYITDGDILSAASAITEFSGYREAQADQGVAGE